LELYGLMLLELEGMERMEGSVSIGGGDGFYHDV
jgi:hypothetical protein